MVCGAGVTVRSDVENARLLELADVRTIEEREADDCETSAQRARREYDERIAAKREGGGVAYARVRRRQVKARETPAEREARMAHHAAANAASYHRVAAGTRKRERRARGRTMRTTAKPPTCPVCGAALVLWHCREVCRRCGFQRD